MLFSPLAQTLYHCLAQVQQYELSIILNFVQPRKRFLSAELLDRSSGGLASEGDCFLDDPLSALFLPEILGRVRPDEGITVTSVCVSMLPNDAIFAVGVHAAKRSKT